MKIEDIIEIGKESIIARDIKYEEFAKALGEAVLNYCKDGEGTIYIDDIEFNLYIKNEWTKVSFYFKVKE